MIPAAGPVILKALDAVFIYLGLQADRRVLAIRQRPAR
jgi:hypothetical protein